MRNLVKILLIALMIVVVGCEYDSPISKPQGIAVDPAVIGLWTKSSDDQNKPDEKLLVLKFTDTEYLLKYSSDSFDGYFRAYPVKFADNTFVQVQFIGTSQGDIEPKMRKYHLIKYDLKKDKLSIGMLNSAVVGDGSTSIEDVRKAMIKNIDNPQLFAHSVEFKKKAE